MLKRKSHSLEFKAEAALEALKSERTVADLASQFGVHPTVIHSWKGALLEGASGVPERSGKKVPEIDEEQVKELHAQIGELAVAKDFCHESSSTGPEVKRGMLEKDNPNLSIGKQCWLLSTSRSSFYYQPRGETAVNLILRHARSSKPSG